MPFRSMYIPLGDVKSDPPRMRILLGLPLLTLPQLTHLPFADWDFIPMCPQILESFMTMRVVVCANTGAMHEEYELILAQGVSVADWHKGAPGRQDSKSSTRRRAREIDLHPWDLGLRVFFSTISNSIAFWIWSQYVLVLHKMAPTPPGGAGNAWERVSRGFP
ncbi:hypothetical protein K438DRAFT_1786016 [Mycena galopus ATCC 62051]|nr:hypothetical protein K438DRAFT_1786016 [Mycena galopus ATCC 62051]